MGSGVGGKQGQIRLEDGPLSEAEKRWNSFRESSVKSDQQILIDEEIAGCFFEATCAISAGSLHAVDRLQMSIPTS